MNAFIAFFFLEKDVFSSMSGALHLYSRRMPMLRLLPPFMLGIGCQWYWPQSPSCIQTLAIVFLLALIINSRLSIARRFFYQQVTGVLLHAFLFLAGAVVVWQQDIRNNKAWLGHHYQPGQAFQLTLQEPLVEKPNSYKALAQVTGLYVNGQKLPVKGQVILYFKKDSITRT
ncbi:MAG TPA: hypothetical protein VD794_14650, partial [Flavisolibacter sp.]|nr:hypothetical protein [Flavisolibacter sp.]